MASLRELNQRRVDRMGGKGLYEGANEGVVNTLRDAIGAPVSPRKSEGVVTPAPAAEVGGAIRNTPVTQQAPQASALGPNAVNLQKNPYDNGFDITPRQGLRREAFGPAIANQGVTSMDRLAGQGYARRDVQGAPGVSRLTGADGRTIYTNNLEDTADWVQGGMRGGTVNSMPAAAFQSAGPAASRELSAALQAAGARGDWDAVRNYYQKDGGTWQGETAQQSQDKALRAQAAELLSGKSRSGRQAAAALIEGERRAEGEAAKLAEATRQAGLRNALDERRLGLDEKRLGIDEKRFEFDKQPKPLSEIDKLQLAEARYGLRERVADRARKELEGRGLTPDQQNRVLENVGESLVDTDPARMQTELAKHLSTVRATDLANQYSLGGLTSAGDVTPVGLRGYKLSEVDLFGNDDPNAPTFSEYLWNLGNDKAIIEDSAGAVGGGGAPGKPVRLINAARVKASGDGKNIDLLRRLGIE